MIAELKPYPAYKDSGVPWLGEVPEYWEVRRLKQAFRRIVGGSTPSSAESKCWDGDVVWVTPSDISRAERLKSSLRRITQEGLKSCSSELVPPGSIIVTSRAPVGNVALADVELCTNQGCKALVTTDQVVNPMFGFAVLRMLKGELQSIATGTTFTEISTSKLGIVSIPLPPILEQSAIARFLDHIDRRIKRYISAKQKLIKLLEQQKLAIIHHAVTRGLDPNVRLKPSGVEWLGEVPDHWEIVPLKRIAWFKSGAGFPVSEQGEQNSEVPFIKVSDMTMPGNEIWIEYTNSTVSKETAARLGAFVFPEETIIFPKVGGALLTNKRRLLRKASCIDNNVMGCVIKGVELQYAFILLQQLDLGRLAKPGPVPAIGEGDVREIKLALPPSKEQIALIVSVRHATDKLVNAIAATQREIELLREYRTRLISDVVTGKLDVREAAAQLPNEVEKPGQLDEAEIEEEQEPNDADGEEEKIVEGDLR